MNTVSLVNIDIGKHRFRLHRKNAPSSRNKFSTSSLPMPPADNRASPGFPEV